MRPFHFQRVLRVGLIIFGFTFLRYIHISLIEDNANDRRWEHMSARDILQTGVRFHQHTTPDQLSLPPGSVRVNRSGCKMVNDLFDKQGTFGFPPIDVSKVPIFPDETGDADDDRIWNQMRYVPPKVAKKSVVKDKQILFFTGYGNERMGSSQFKGCPVDRCQLIAERSRHHEADVVVWQNSVSETIQRRPNQIWAIFMLESVRHTFISPSFLNMINWTMTYRHDSTIVTPYYKFTPYRASGPLKQPSRNYAHGKTKKVAWFVSNCGAVNRRLDYAKQLAQYINVDIYGACGPYRCPRGDRSCFELLNKDYKFYLAFENSNCRDYITEKFFLNGLSNDVIPIAMGAHPDDYKRQAPEQSFIHVDNFASPEDLAKYLHYLDRNDTAYNTYFAWKGTGLVDTNTFFWCRLCMAAHEADNRPPVVTQNALAWWTKGACVSNRWKPPQRKYS